MPYPLSLFPLAGNLTDRKPRRAAALRNLALSKENGRRSVLSCIQAANL